MRNHVELLNSGNKAQLEKLKENDHKEDYEKMTVLQAVYRLSQEVEELEAEVYTGHCVNPRPDFSAVRREAADVANFAHIIILACDKRLAKNE